METKAPLDEKILLKELAGLQGLLSLRGDRKDLAFVAQILDGICRLVLRKYEVTTVRLDLPRLHLAFIGSLASVEVGTASANTLFARALPEDLRARGWSIDQFRHVIEGISTAVGNEDTREQTIHAVQNHLSALYTLCLDLLTDEVEKGVREFRKAVSVGEDEHTEFKSTLRFNLHTGAVDTKLEKEVIKTIAGFVNYQGGTLCIGVEDNGQVVGLEYDFSTLTKGMNKADNFRRHFTQIVIEHLGAENYQLLDCNLVRVEEKDIFVVVVKAAEGPVYDKDGTTDRLWVRMGASTPELNAREAIEYYKRHWKQT